MPPIPQSTRTAPLRLAGVSPVADSGADLRREFDPALARSMDERRSAGLPLLVPTVASTRV